MPKNPIISTLHIVADFEGNLSDAELTEMLDTIRGYGIVKSATLNIHNPYTKDLIKEGY